MNRFGRVFLFSILAGPLCFGQAASSASAAPAVIGHGAFPVKVTKTLDSSKLKQDDNVEVETAGSFKMADGTLVPKGSKLSGHVMAAKARAKGDSDSELSVVFDKLNIAGGKSVSLKGQVQAVFSAPDEQMDASLAGAATAAAGGSSRGGAGVGTVTDANIGSDTQSSSRAQAVVDPKAVGVHGIHDLTLEDGVLRSKGKNVKLGSGVRMIVHVDILG